MLSILTDELPCEGDPDVIRRGEERWHEHAIGSGNPANLRFAVEALADTGLRSLFHAVFAYSPYLTLELIRNIAFVEEIVDLGPDLAFDRLIGTLQALDFGARPTPSVMAALRQAKRKAALLTGLADIAGAWRLDDVTGAMTRTAETCLNIAVAHLLSTPAFARLPSDGTGLVILGMGKLGAGELNYSSDIDLIIFYDDAKFGSADIGQDFVRLARAVVRVMEERTGDGYVFRTDLRLRPDPGAMPLAVSMSTAEIYYGSLGQNWERAAMIKARQIVGDRDSGRSLLAFLTPWVWRRSLDFAAIEDIHSIKRQINQHKLKPRDEALLGHNVKLGRGGIREIEFYAQTQQLIFGGRDATLRAPATRDALGALAAARRITPEAADEMIEAYGFLRKLEHRLQMVDDQQTHTLPMTAEAVARIAGFMGFPDRAAFSLALSGRLDQVNGRFLALFGKSPSLSGSGSLVFTGAEDDPDTLATLGDLGFANPHGIADSIRGWHHGRYRAMRSERAREILTRITPDLLAALARTAEPDAAFLRFDGFLAALPAGVTLLSLFDENRSLLGLIGGIMGMAPSLAEHLAHNPGLFDELLTSDFFAEPPDIPALAEDLERALDMGRYYEGTGDYEDALARIRRWASGRKFQAGVHILESISDGEQAGRFLAAIAETALTRLLPLVEREFAIRHGRIAGGGFAVIAFGRLGGRLMSFSSDLDLVTIYDAPEGATSDGDKPLDAALYFTRLTQRLIAAITARMADGRLYSVDLRLRPSGEAGPVAAGLEAFRRYHAPDDGQAAGARQAGGAWTWEHMALTRARVIAGPAMLSDATQAVIEQILTAPRDPESLLADVAGMRLRIAEQRKPLNRWDLKYTPGGLFDIEFTVQYLMLREAHRDPGLLTSETAVAIERLRSRRHLSDAAAADLARALRLAWCVQGLIRLTTERGFDPESAPAAIRARLTLEVASATGATDDGPVDFVQAETILDSILAASHDRYQEIVGRPAAKLSATKLSATKLSATKLLGGKISGGKTSAD
jgi:glutamate-ammonia-ligase adenylyltransferase